MKKILLINASFRDDSRTKELTDYLMSKLNGEVTTLDLEKMNLKPLTNEELKERNKALELGNMNHPLFKEAHLFRDADLIVMSTPYYDFSFSSLIKIFIEHINIDGLTFKFTEDGQYKKMCNANDVIYVTTAGGELLVDYGFNYIKALDEVFYGIKNTHLIKAENLDIVGVDIAKQLDNAKKDIDLLLTKLDKEYVK